MINKDRAIVVHCPKSLHHFFVIDRIDMSSSTKINSISKALWSYSKMSSFLFSANLECYFPLLCVSIHPVLCFISFLDFCHSPFHPRSYSLSTTCLSSSIESGSVPHISLNRSYDAVCLYMLLSKRMRLFLWNVCVFMSTVYRTKAKYLYKFKPK